MDYPWKLFVREMLTWTLKKAPKYWGLFAVSFTTLNSPDLIGVMIHRLRERITGLEPVTQVW